MRVTSRPWALPAWWGVLFAGLACQPAPPGGPAEGPEMAGPAPLAAKAKLALAELSPAVARPEDAADADNLGANAPNITDAIFLLGYLFQGTAEPPPPTPSAATYAAPGDCGPDPNGDADGMGCQTFTPCGTGG